MQIHSTTGAYYASSSAAASSSGAAAASSSGAAASSSGAAAAAAASSSGAAAAVDPGKFMQMLLAQLSNQNPMEPMKDAEMMGQMAQLNSLQELQRIQHSLEEMAMSNQASYAASLIGKTVRAEKADKTVEGAVTGVTMDGSQMKVHIGEEVVTLDQVREIRAEEAE